MVIFVDTVEGWAQRYIQSEDLADKLDPEEPPREWAEEPGALRLTGPGRPKELDVQARSKRSLRPSQLQDPRRRAQLVHTFLHHELQAAELMCWALLAFPEAPVSFRRGLLGICLDEIRHMQMYRDYLVERGFDYGSFSVRDWFWERTATCATPLEFVALMGMGLEGGNLDHASRYTKAFAEAGDEAAAELQRVVALEEIPHVRFATKWFREWSGGLDFDRWADSLVGPLTPALFRGREIDFVARRQAGFTDEFLARLADAK
jgi:uncharacterized ferritin-like protein (DUF455 family)